MLDIMDGMAIINFVTENVGVLSLKGQRSYNHIVLHGFQPVSRTPILCDKKSGAWGGLMAFKAIE